MKVKEESEKAGLKLNTQKTKFIASGPVTSWQIYGEKSGDSGRFYLFSWAPKSLQMVIAAIKLKDACSLEEKHLLISWLQSPTAVILEPPKIKSLTVHCFPIYLP